MNKSFITCVALASILFLPVTHAAAVASQQYRPLLSTVIAPSSSDDPTEDFHSSADLPIGSSLEGSTLEEIEGTPVGAAANEGMSAAKKRQWQNIILAVVAVAAAITALLLVSRHEGHKSTKQS